MNEPIEARLKELRGEFAAGEARLREVDAEQARLRETLLRIDGAVLALTELLQGGDAERRQAEAARNGSDPARQPVTTQSD